MLITTTKIDIGEQIHYMYANLMSEMNSWIYSIKKSKNHAVQNQKSKFDEIKMNIDIYSTTLKEDGKQALHRMIKQKMALVIEFQTGMKYNVKTWITPDIDTETFLLVLNKLQE